MGKSAWYQVDTSRVYAASPAPPKEPVPDGDEWLDDYKPKDWQAQNDELDEQVRSRAAWAVSRCFFAFFAFFCFFLAFFAAFRSFRSFSSADDAESSSDGIALGQ